MGHNGVAEEYLKTGIRGRSLSHWQAGDNGHGSTTLPIYEGLLSSHLTSYNITVVEACSTLWFPCAVWNKSFPPLPEAGPMETLSGLHSIHHHPVLYRPLRDSTGPLSDTWYQLVW